MIKKLNQKMKIYVKINTFMEKQESYYRLYKNKNENTLQSFLNESPNILKKILVNKVA